MARTSFEKWLIATAGAFQPIEDSFQQLLVGRGVNDAQGVLLDNVGDFVGRPRNGISDDEIYRRYIRAQISRNRSDGTPDNLLKIEQLVVYDEDAIYIREERGNAQVVHRIEGVVISEAIGKVLREIVLGTGAQADGVRLVLEWFGAPLAEMFQFAPEDADIAADIYDDDIGFGDAEASVADYDPSAVGGELAYAAE